MKPTYQFMQASGPASRRTCFTNILGLVAMNTTSGAWLKQQMQAHEMRSHHRRFNDHHRCYHDAVNLEDPAVVRSFSTPTMRSSHTYYNFKALDQRLSAQSQQWVLPQVQLSTQ